MSQHTHMTDNITIVLGAVTSSAIGSIVFQGLGTLLLGLLGACGGWIFITFIRPYFERKLQERKERKNKTKA